MSSGACGVAEHGAEKPRMAAITPHKLDMKQTDPIATPERFNVKTLRDAYYCLIRNGVPASATPQVEGFVKGLVNEMRSPKVATSDGSNAQALALGYAELDAIMSPTASPESVCVE